MDETHLVGGGSGSTVTSQSSLCSAYAFLSILYQAVKELLKLFACTKCIAH